MILIREVYILSSGLIFQILLLNIFWHLFVFSNLLNLTKPNLNLIFPLYYRPWTFVEGKNYLDATRNLKDVNLNKLHDSYLFLVNLNPWQIRQFIIFRQRYDHSVLEWIHVWFFFLDQSDSELLQYIMVQLLSKGQANILHSNNLKS